MSRRSSRDSNEEENQRPEATAEVRRGIGLYQLGTLRRIQELRHGSTS